MPKIKFSHIYKKLLNEHNDCIEFATLLDVIPVKLENLSKYFLAYDTDNGKYQLPKSGKYLLLIFKKVKDFDVFNADDIFTTIRRETPEKHTYYRKLIGRGFDVVVQDNDKENWKEKCKDCLYFNNFLSDGTVSCQKGKDIKIPEEVLKCKDKE